MLTTSRPSSTLKPSDKAARMNALPKASRQAVVMSRGAIPLQTTVRGAMAALLMARAACRTVSLGAVGRFIARPERYPAVSITRATQ